MALQVGELFAAITANNTQFQNVLNSSENMMMNVAKSMKKTGKSMSKFVTLPILAAGVASFKLASDLSENMNKTDVAFKDNAGEVKTWAKNSLTNFGMAESSALDAASLFGDMGTSMGISTGEAAKMSTSLTGLAGDLASFKNIGVDQAQTALKGVFTGETESLKGLGIVMTQTNLSAFAMSQGITKNIKDMTQAELVNLRYGFVLANTGNAQGDFARTSDGAANQMRIFQESVKELGASFGGILLPIFTPMIAKLNEMVQWFKTLSVENQTTIIMIAGIAAAIGPLLVIGGTLISSLMTMWASFTAVTTAVSAAGGVIAVLSGPIGWAIAAIAAIIAVGVLLYKNWDTIIVWGKKLWKYIDPLWDDIEKTISEAIGEVTKFVGEQLDKISEFWDENGEEIMNYIQPVLDWIKKEFIEKFKQYLKTVKNTWEGIKVATELAWSLIKFAISNAMDLIMSGIKIALALFKGDWSGAWEEAKVLLTNIWNNMVQFIKNINLYDAGVAVIQGMINGISAKAKDLYAKAKNIAKSVTSTVMGAFKINSPSKVFHYIGSGLLEGMENGIDAESRNLLGDLMNLAGKVKNSMSGIGIESPQISASGFGSGSTTETNFVDAIASGVGNALLAISNLNSTADSKEVVIQIDGIKMARALIPQLSKENNRLGAIIA